MNDLSKLSSWPLLPIKTLTMVAKSWMVVSLRIPFAQSLALCISASSCAGTSVSSIVLAGSIHDS